ncbi:MAG: universal stress protein [Actinomycetota bacterium]|nr:universal stress protein [Actinomycetota bacterium]
MVNYGAASDNAGYATVSGSVGRRSEIVVGLDESESARAALRWAAEEAARSGSGLRAVHALSWPFGAEYADPEHAVRTVSFDEVDDLYRSNISRIFSSVKPRPDWILQFAQGDAGPVLVRQSAQAAMLVVGTPYHVGLGRLISGSVAHYCLSHATCPVVAVPATHLSTSTPGSPTPGKEDFR